MAYFKVIFIFYSTCIIHTPSIVVFSHIWSSPTVKEEYISTRLHDISFQRVPLLLTQYNWNSNPNLFIPPISCLPGITFKPNITFPWVVLQFHYQAKIIKSLLTLRIFSIPIHLQYLFVSASNILQSYFLKLTEGIATTEFRNKGFFPIYTNLPVVPSVL